MNKLNKISKCHSLDSHLALHFELSCSNLVTFLKVSLMSRVCVVNQLVVVEADYLQVSTYPLQMTQRRPNLLQTLLLALQLHQIGKTLWAYLLIYGIMKSSFRLGLNFV